jgi:lipopolysaccharide export system protein LptA
MKNFFSFMLFVITTVGYADFVDHEIDVPIKPAAKENISDKEKQIRPIKEKKESVEKKDKANEVEKTSDKKKKEGSLNTSKGKKIPVVFSGSTLEADEKTGIVILKRDVFVKREIVEIRADMGEITSNQDKTDVKKIEAKGKVSIVRLDPTNPIQAFGDRVVYDPEKEEITIFGNAQVIRDGDKIFGDKIVFYPHTGTVRAEKVNGSMTR